MSKRFTLSGMWLSGPTYKVGLMLNLCGQDYAYQAINMMAGEHKSPAFLAKNRYGQVPVLEDSQTGLALCQSAAILEYLADELGQFQAQDAAGRARAREWMYWDFDRLAGPIYRSRAQRFGIRAFGQTVMEMYWAEGNMALKTVDQALSASDWLAGPAPTIADIDVYGSVAYAPQAGFDLGAYPAIGAWMKRVEALPGFAPVTSLLPRESRP